MAHLSPTSRNRWPRAALPALLGAAMLSACQIELVRFPFIQFEDEQQASAAVIGQPNLESRQAPFPPAANSLSGPRGNVHFHDGVLYVPDTGNNRVLAFSGIPSLPHRNAQFALGQQDLQSSDDPGPQADSLFRPQGVSAYDDNLSIADTGESNTSSNHRVLLWDSIPDTSGTSASRALGQQNLTSSLGGCTGGDTMRRPASVWLHDGMVFVADTHNHRVLIWEEIPDTTPAPPADIVLGQPDETSCFSNGPDGQVDAASLNQPSDAWSDGQRLIVADSGNHRVLIWENLPDEDQAAADIVLGQQDMTSRLTTPVRADTLNTPRRLAVGNNQLFVADTGNFRVLIWDGIPDSDTTLADRVLGQPDMTTRNQPVTPRADNIGEPHGVHLAQDKLLVTDRAFNRVLIFEEP